MEAAPGDIVRDIRDGAEPVLMPMGQRDLVKDVVMLGGYQTMDIDFDADNPGRRLFHCHQQLHMDFGFMAPFDYV
jgi:FtsP/CotA-like multicopper oxidase with cupredoxin domain